MDILTPDQRKELIMSESTDPEPIPAPGYTDTRMVKLGGSDGATEFHGYSIDEVIRFMTFMQGLSSDEMTATFAEGRRP